MSLPKEFSSGAVVIYGDTQQPLYLLVYSGRNHMWGLPKGHIESGENEQDAARREIAEETGLVNLSFLRNARIEISYPAVSKRGALKGKAIEKHAIYFICRSERRDVRVDTVEITDYRWAGRDEAIALVAFAGAQGVIQEADALIRRYAGDAAAWNTAPLQ